MLEVLKFIFARVIEFIKMLFTIDVGFTNLGTVMCIVYIFLPVILIIVNFFKKQLIEEIDDAYDIKRRIYRTGGSGSGRRGYTGKHEFSGRHSKEYFKRQKIKERWDKR